MDLFLAVIVVTWFIKNLVTDVKYAARGKTPPRIELKLARLRAQGKPTSTARYLFRDYFGDLASDSLVTATEKRRARKARKAAAAQPPVPVQVPDPVVVPDPGPAQAPEPDEEDAPVRDRPEPAEGVDDRPLARVIPIFRPKTDQAVPSTTEPKEKTLSEITGLQSAVSYAEAVAEAHAAHSTGGGESILTSLQQANVTGATLAAVEEAQEASSMAAAAWGNAAEKLKEQIGVKEAYDNNPDAGKQEFVQGE